MNNHRVLALLLTLIFGIGSALGQQPKPQDGYWWADSGEGFKVGFVSGYVIAMNSVGDANTFKCFAEKNGGTVPAKLPSEAVFAECAKRPDVAAFDYAGFRAGQWRQGVDEFYNDYRNKGLEIRLAMRYVQEQLHGKPAKELEDEVAGWRRSAVSK